MNLDQFVLELHKDVEAFKEYYSIQHRGSPEMWPLTMEYDGDWYEQYTAYVMSELDDGTG